MCLYPRLIKNPKYKVTKKNGGNVPPVTDPRVMYVPIGCQECMECRKQKANHWSVRLQEEIRTDRSGQFVTLTFRTESLIKLKNELEGIEGYDLDNEIVTLAVRRFLERWRKKYGKSVKHWLVTELGHGVTEHVHVHGLIFANHKEAKEDIKKIWGYGFVYIGDYVNDRTINYMVKYVNKMDVQHQGYKAKILCSAGIGSGYINRLDAKLNKYKEGQTDETYKTRQGRKVGLPIYWRNKIYSEEEREKLWIKKLDEGIRWVGGRKVDTKKRGIEEYYRVLKEEQQRNIRLGYGKGEVNWDRVRYENERRKMIYEKRFNDWVNNLGGRMPTDV